MSADYVYRLRVLSYPEGVDEDNPPKGWEPRWGDDPHPDGREEERFRWPALRRCLSATTAKRWADRLREWGAVVEVERSLPVEWPQPPSEGALRRVEVLEAVARGERGPGSEHGPIYLCREPGCEEFYGDEDYRDAHEYLARHGDYGANEVWTKGDEEG